MRGIIKNQGPQNLEEMRAAYRPISTSTSSSQTPIENHAQKPGSLERDSLCGQVLSSLPMLASSTIQPALTSEHMPTIALYACSPACRVIETNKATLSFPITKAPSLSGREHQLLQQPNDPPTSHDMGTSGTAIRYSCGSQTTRHSPKEV